MRRMFERGRDNRGFSLLEALIAIAILGFGLMAVVTMLDVAFSAGTLSKSMTTSTELAAYMMDRISFDTLSTTDPFSADAAKLISFNGMDTNAAAPMASPASNAFAQWQQWVRLNLPRGQGTVTVSQDDPVNFPKQYSVTVRVFWTTIMTRSVALRSVFVVP